MHEPIATHKGEGWHLHETTNIYVKDDYTIIEIIDRKTKKEIKFRNVEDRNPECSIQFSVDEYSYATNRTKSISFSIPYSLSELFIKNLMNEKA